jgi:hypothetical protein
VLIKANTAVKINDYYNITYPGEIENLLKTEIIANEEQTPPNLNTVFEFFGKKKLTS